MHGVIVKGILSDPRGNMHYSKKEKEEKINF